MKRLVWLLLPVLGRGAVENVRVLGTTATQAVIAYTAPNTSACELAVTSTVAYAPAVYDVAEDIFPGAKYDDRSGNITAGRARIFVVGKRAAERASDGKVYSRALQADTLHNFTITCRGDTATGSFRTSNIPLGNTWADPLPADPAVAGGYLWPDLSNTDRTASVIDPHTGALIKNLVLPGDMADQTISVMGTSGVGFLCHETPVKASDEDKYGYHCQLSVGASSLPMLYWIAPSDGEVRNLGMLRSDVTSEHYGGYCQGLTTGPFSSSDPNTFYCLNINRTYDKYLVVKGVYSGHDTAGYDKDLTQVSISVVTPHSTWTNLTPTTGTTSRDLLTLVAEFAPEYDRTAYASVVYDGVQAEKLIAHSWGNNQDSTAWIFVFDPNRKAHEQTAIFGSDLGCVAHDTEYKGAAGCVVAAMRTHAGGEGGANRWCSLHTLVNARTGGWINAQANVLTTTGKALGPYQVTISEALTASGGSCPAQPSDSWLTNWPTTGCDTVTVSGEPASAYDASTAGAAQVGDVVSLGTTFASAEFVRILVKNSATSWVVERGYGASAHKARAQSAATVATMMCGGLDPFDTATGGDFWWNYENDPYGTGRTTVINDPHFNDGHVAHAAGTNASWSVASGYTAVAGFPPDRFRKTSAAAASIGGFPKFNGLSTLQSWNVVEGHPSYGQTRATAAEANWMLDMRPYRGDYTTATSARVSLVGGRLYKISGATTLTNNFKKIPIFAHSGTSPMRDISSAATGDVIGTASDDSYRYCVALRSNECRQGSSAGDIYFNAPGVINAYCTNNRFKTAVADVCVSQMGMYFNGMAQIGLIRTDSNGRYGRVITRALSQYNGMSDYWNTRALPDASWAFTTMGPVGGYLNIKLVKLPAFPAPDSIDRSRFVDLPVQLTSPAGVDNVIVEFGYAENGSADAFFCTTRREVCVKGNQSGGNYSFAAETVQGVACSAGCSIRIPAIPQRVLYYRARYRDVNLNTISTGAMRAVTIP